MADTIKISALPVVTTSAAADSIPIIQGGVTSRIHPGPGGGLDADTASGYGIGGGTIYSDFNAVTGNGAHFKTTATPSNAPVALADYFVGTQWYVNNDANYRVQLCHPLSNTTGWFWRRMFNTTWETSWHKIWDDVSDGNGGQPPAPKLTTGTPAGGANSPGQGAAASIGAGAIVYYSGATNLTGQWFVYNITYVVATGVIDPPNTGGGVGNGAAIAAVPAGEATKCFCWRMS